jgi:hypothetical protein
VLFCGGDGTARHRRPRRLAHAHPRWCVFLPTRRPYCSLLGAGAMTTWAIKDSSGQVLPGFLGSSRIEVGCNDAGSL